MAESALDLIFADATGAEIGYVSHYGFDLAYGDDENDFTMDVPINKGSMFAKGSKLYFDGTGWGGIVYGGVESTFGRRPSYTVRGRSWEGVADERFIVPRGESHVIVSGDANECIAQVLSLAGLDGVFSVPDHPSGFLVQGFVFDRFTSVYRGFRKMVRPLGAKIVINKQPGELPTFEAVPAVVYADFDNEDRCRYRMAWEAPYNHIIAAGQGEMEDRALVELFADEDGAVSATQSIFGLLERQYRYEYTTDDLEKLEVDARKKLEDLQKTDELRLELPEDLAADVGDIVRSVSATTGNVFQAEVAKVVVHVDKSGQPKVTNEIGDPQIIKEA